MDDTRRTFAHPPSSGSPSESAEERAVPRHERQDPDASREDEAAAEEARLRYRTKPMVALEPDPAIARFLRPGEALLASRRAVRCERRQDEPRLGGTGLCGDLYLTSARLELLGRARIGIELDSIDEVLVCSERLLLMMRDGTGITLEVEWPRLLRVEIATARASARD